TVPAGIRPGAGEDRRAPARQGRERLGARGRRAARMQFWDSAGPGGVHGDGHPGPGLSEIAPMPWTLHCRPRSRSTSLTVVRDHVRKDGKAELTRVRTYDARSLPSIALFWPGS